jgi:G3E family GTPase
MTEPIPVFVLTGFLGSGKTTLLKSLLADREMQDTAVIVNEFGEVGLDHLLVREVTDEIVLLGSGCVCCTVRDDLVSTLSELHALRETGEITRFSRVVVETTGLADPAPILTTLMEGRGLAGRYALCGLIATVDAMFGAGQLDAHEEARKQAALAERLILTKTDLAAPETSQVLRDRLHALNPAASVVESTPRTLPGARLLLGLENIRGRPAPRAVNEWINAEAYVPVGTRDRKPNHDERIATFCIRIVEPLAWEAVIEWLELLLASRGESVLRMKGLLHVAGKRGPLVMQGVQHILYPPLELARWPDDDRSTRLVFITRDLTRSAVETSLRQVLGANVAIA